MSEMIERVARALAEARGITPRTLPPEALWLYFPKEQAFAEARAAIEAMREPTQEMNEAGQSNNYGRYATEAWKAMIDASLK